MSKWPKVHYASWVSPCWYNLRFNSYQSRVDKKVFNYMYNDAASRHLLCKHCKKAFKKAS